MDLHMHEVGEEDEHFQDFTAASEWEEFTVQLERVLTEWQAGHLDSSAQAWLVLHEELKFAGFPFKVSLYRRQTSSCGQSLGDMATHLPPFLQSLLEDVEEFPPKASPHLLSELFCLTEFCVLSPCGEGAEPIGSESRLKVLLSAASLALNNTNTNFPLFVQFHDWEQNYFCGVAESCGVRTSLQMIHLRHVPNALEHNYLSGLVGLFKSKAALPAATPIVVSAHFFFTMASWHADYSFDTPPHDVLEVLKATECPASATCSATWEQSAFTRLLPFGCAEDPFAALTLATGWPRLGADAVVDTAAYSDLDPLQAPHWFFTLKAQKQLKGRLAEALDGLWRLEEERKTIEDVLGKTLRREQEEPTGDDVMSALDRIAVRGSPLSVVERVVKNVHMSQVQLFSPLNYVDLPPVAKEDLDVLLLFFFPDASSFAKCPYPSDASSDRHPTFHTPHLQACLEALRSAKSGPLGGLVWRLGVVLPFYTSVGGVGGVAHIWAEFVLEIRYRWENSILIPGLEAGHPNPGTCFLNQKLQMLNCCIEKKRGRERVEVESARRDLERELPAEEGPESDDEFFDCEDSLPSTVEESQGPCKPAGRLEQCGSLRLLNTGDILYIPITQDTTPLTEDRFEEQSQMLVALGDDEEGTEQRAKLMSASLASDMQAFKAANPGCVLDDFVRWYSPRDWVHHAERESEGQSCGELSMRMRMPGNLWQEVWASSPAVPARRQKRLFDDTKEAENILSWLSSRTLRDISQLTFPCLAHAATLRVLEESETLGVACKGGARVVQHLAQLTRSLGDEVLRQHSPPTRKLHTAEESSAHRTTFLASLAYVERQLCEERSFRHKFKGLDLKEALPGRDVEGEGQAPYAFPNYVAVKGGGASPLGQRIRHIFQQELAIQDQAAAANDFVFEEPLKKVFVLKCVPQKGATHGALPQRMSCSLKRKNFSSELMVAGTFSLQTEFV